MRESPQAFPLQYGQPAVLNDRRTTATNVLNISPVSLPYHHTEQDGYSDQHARGARNVNLHSFNSAPNSPAHRMPVDDVQSITSHNSAVVYYGYPDAEQVRKMEEIQRQEIASTSKDRLLGASKKKGYVLKDDVDGSESSSNIASKLSRLRKHLYLQIKITVIVVCVLLLSILALLVYILLYIRP